MTLRRRKESRFYWYRFMHRGRIYQGSTRETDIHKARVAERRIRKAIEASPPPPRERLALAILADLDEERGMRDGILTVTQRTTYRIHWRHLQRLLGDKHPSDIGAADIDAYILARRAAKVTGQTIRKELQTLRRGLQLAKRRKLIDDVFDDWPKLRNDPKSKQLSGKRWPVETVIKWLNLLPEHIRDELYFDLLTGLRATELRNARFDWIKPAPPGCPTPAILEVPPGAGKNKREGRVVGLTHEALEIIDRRRQAGSSDGTIFGKGGHKFHYDTISKTLGLAMNITRRDLRHMFASLALEHTQDARAVMAALGHKDLEMTSRYLHTETRRAAAASSAVASALTAPEAPIAPAQRVTVTFSYTSAGAASTEQGTWTASLPKFGK